MDNYYEILGIDIEASTDEIKRATYKKNKYFESLLEQNKKEELTQIKSKQFFLKTIEKTLLDNQKRNVYNKKIQDSLKRKLDKPNHENINNQIAEQEIQFGSFKTYGVFTKVKGVIVKGVSVSEKKIGSKTVFYLSLKNIIIPIAKIIVTILIIIFLKIWGILILIIWQFKDLRSTPLSKILGIKTKIIKQFVPNYFYNVKKLFKPKPEVITKLNFSVRIEKNNTVHIRIKNNPVRGILNPGDKVSLIAYGFEDDLNFLSGINLRSNIRIRTT